MKPFRSFLCLMRCPGFLFSIRLPAERMASAVQMMTKAIIFAAEGVSPRKRQAISL